MREAKTWILIALQIHSKDLIYFDSEKKQYDWKILRENPFFQNQIILIYYHLIAA